MIKNMNNSMILMMIKKIINFHQIKLMIFNNILQWTVIMLHNFIELMIIKEEKFINSIKKSNSSTVTKLMTDKKNIINQIKI